MCLYSYISGVSIFWYVSRYSGNALMCNQLTPVLAASMPFSADTNTQSFTRTMKVRQVSSSYNAVHTQVEAYM